MATTSESEQNAHGNAQTIIVPDPALLDGSLCSLYWTDLPFHILWDEEHFNPPTNDFTVYQWILEKQFRRFYGHPLFIKEFQECQRTKWRLPRSDRRFPVCSVF